MQRKTIKELESELAMKNNEIEELKKQLKDSYLLCDRKRQENEDFRSMVSGKNLQIIELKQKNAKAYDDYIELRDMHRKIESVHKIKNERGAGRKPIDIKTREYIEGMIESGRSVRYMAASAEISVGAVHKILKEYKLSKEIRRL